MRFPFLVAVLGAAWTVAASATTPTLTPATAVVEAADGPLFDLVRGDRLFAGARGANLSAGDMIRTQPGNILILEFKSGPSVTAIAAIGPSTSLYWMDREGPVTLAVLSGWVKIAAATAVPQAMVVTQGTRLQAASDGGSYVMHVSGAADEVFQEGGSIRLEVSHARSGDTGDAGVPSRPDQLTRRSAAGQIQTRLGADAAFVAALPPAFRDPLPTGLGSHLYETAQPQLVRDVTYDDVSDWLAAPKEWRRGFVRRFRPRLKDPAFFQALDAQMTTHPEWGPILHPPAQTLTLSSVSQQH